MLTWYTFFILANFQGEIVAASVSWDGLFLATASVDKAVKIFDIINFGMLARLQNLIYIRHDKHTKD